MNNDRRSAGSRRGSRSRWFLAAVMVPVLSFNDRAWAQSGDGAIGASLLGVSLLGAGTPGEPEETTEVEGGTEEILSTAESGDECYPENKVTLVGTGGRVALTAAGAHMMEKNRAKTRRILNSREKAALRPSYQDLVDKVRVTYGAALLPDIPIYSPAGPLAPPITTIKMQEGYVAQTFGNEIYFRRNDPREWMVEQELSDLVHEVRHSEQAQELGGIGNFGYYYAYNWDRADYVYADNCMEKEAREAEEAYRSSCWMRYRQKAFEESARWKPILDRILMDLFSRNSNPKFELDYLQLRALVLEGRGSVVANLITGREARNGLLLQSFATILRRPSDRLPSQADLDPLHGHLENPSIPAHMRWGFVRSILLGSDEYFTQRCQGNLETFVKNLFDDCLGRQPSDGELRDRLQSLTGVGQRAPWADRSSLIRDVVFSAEATRKQVKDLFQRYLRRPPNPRELGNATLRISGGMSYERLICELFNTEDYLRWK